MIWCKDFRLIKDIWKGKYPKGYKRIKLYFIEKIFMSVFIFFRCISPGNIFALKFSNNTRPKIIDLYVSAWLVIFCMLLFTIGYFLSTTYLIFFIIFFVMYRLIEGVNYLLCIIFVDRYKRSWHFRSLNRSLLILFIYYVQVITGFAILYLATASIRYSVSKITVTNPWDAFYFSTVTITTLGYGDIEPICWYGKLFSILEPLLGIILVVLVIGIFLTERKDKSL